MKQFVGRRPGQSLEDHQREVRAVAEEMLADMAKGRKEDVSDEISNARIVSTMLGIEDHGLTTAWIHLDFGHFQQGFGGYMLGTEDEPHRACGLFVRRAIEVVGVESWESLKNAYVRARHNHSKVHAIGNIIDDELWFCPADELEKL